MSSHDFFLLMVVTFIALDTNCIKISICLLYSTFGLYARNIPYIMITCILQLKKKFNTIIQLFMLPV